MWLGISPKTFYTVEDGKAKTVELDLIQRFCRRIFGMFKETHLNHVASLAMRASFNRGDADTNLINIFLLMNKKQRYGLIQNTLIDSGDYKGSYSYSFSYRVRDSKITALLFKVVLTHPEGKQEWASGKFTHEGSKELNLVIEENSYVEKGKRYNKFLCSITRIVQKILGDSYKTVYYPGRDKNDGKVQVSHFCMLGVELFHWAGCSKGGLYEYNSKNSDQRAEADLVFPFKELLNLGFAINNGFAS